MTEEETRQELKDSVRVAITGRDIREAEAQEEKSAARAEADKQIHAMIGPVKEVIKTLVNAVGKGLGAFASAVMEKK